MIPERNDGNEKKKNSYIYICKALRKIGCCIENTKKLYNNIIVGGLPLIYFPAQQGLSITLHYSNITVPTDANLIAVSSQNVYIALVCF